MQPRSSSPKSGRTMSIVIRKTIAIKVTHTLKSFSRYLTASPTKRRTIRTITPKIGAMILVGTPVSALAPIAVPVRSPPIYASPPMVIAMMTRPHKMFRRSGRSAKSCFMFSARPSCVMIPILAAIPCMTITAITEKTTHQKSVKP